MAFNLDSFEGLLAKEMALRGETPASFARRAGCTPGALHDIRHVDAATGRPRRQPSAAMILKLANALGVPVAALHKDQEVAAS